MLDIIWFVFKYAYMFFLCYKAGGASSTNTFLGLGMFLFIQLSLYLLRKIARL